MLTVALTFLAFASSVAAQVRPNEAWQTLFTEHFRVTFPEGLEWLGRRAAARAEEAYRGLAEAFLEPPGGPIDLLVTDHTDVSNGSARVTPSDRITVFARPPVDELGLGYFDDWMELVITHELAHIVHLSHTGNPLGRALRGVFGRAPLGWPYFPGLDTPRWLIEGLATWYESELTQSGRLQGTFHEMQIRTAALEGRFETLGQASGESAVWPGGNRSYAYGSMFFQYLLDRHGAERMSVFAEAIAGQWVPYRLDSAGRKAFGVSLSDAWRAWGDSLRSAQSDLDARLMRLGPITESEALTSEARWALYPRVSPDGSSLAYVRSDGRSDTQIRVVDPDGRGGAQLTRTNGLATFGWTADGSIVFAQLDYADLFDAFSDLYLVDREGRVRRITEGARLSHPSPAPDGRWAVAVQEGEGTSELVRVDLATGAVSDIGSRSRDTYWAFPRLSPDGRWIVATRWAAPGFHDVVVVDARSGGVVAEVTRDRALDMAPAWAPDGRSIVWASDRTGILNVMGATVDPASGRAGPPRLLTNVRTGAAYPAVGPEGRWLYFSAYHVDGWELERIPYVREGMTLAPTADGRFERGLVVDPPDPTFTSPVSSYSPLPTLAPRYWEPVLREPVRTSSVVAGGVAYPGRELLAFGVGAQTSGWDLVGRHAYEVFGRAFTSGGKVEGGASYAFLGFGNPALAVAAGQFWDDDGIRLARQADTDPYEVLHVLQRERLLQGTMAVQARRWRSVLQLALTGGVAWEDRTLLGDDLLESSTYRLSRPGSELSDLRAALTFSNVRSHSFQLGASRGVSLLLSGRLRDELSVPDSLSGVAGSDRSVDDLIGRVRAFLPLRQGTWAPHVLAVQASAGAARGPNAGVGHFDVGGASGSKEGLTGLGLFGGEPLIFPVRGYRDAERGGRYAWAASAEYRFPVALVHWGFGAWPLYLGRIVGTLFADAGNAWGPDSSPEGFNNSRRIPLASAGAEVSTEFLGFYDVSLITRLGVAAPLVDGRGAVFYLRLGLPF